MTIGLACKYGKLTNLLRVGSTAVSDYTVLNQTPIQVLQSIWLVQPSTIKWSEVKLRNMEIFRVAGTVCQIQPGDIIQTDPSAAVTIPTITIYQNGLGTFGFKSDRVGDIRNGANLVYQNIQFAYLPSSDYPGKPLDREFKDTMALASVEVIIYKRNLRSSVQDVEGLYLHQTDTAPEVRWVIQSSLEYGNCQVLTLKRDG
jgi:hypothetical protein